MHLREAEGSRFSCSVPECLPDYHPGRLRCVCCGRCGSGHSAIIVDPFLESSKSNYQPLYQLLYSAHQTELTMVYSKNAHTTIDSVVNLNDGTQCAG